MTFKYTPCFHDYRSVKHTKFRKDQKGGEVKKHDTLEDDIIKITNASYSWHQSRFYRLRKYVTIGSDTCPYQRVMYDTYSYHTVKYKQEWNET